MSRGSHRDRQSFAEVVRPIIERERSTLIISFHCAMGRKERNGEYIQNTLKEYDGISLVLLLKTVFGYS